MHTIRFHNILKSLAGLILLTSITLAQERSCRIIFPAMPHGAPKTAFLFDGKMNHEVQLPSMNFSKVIKLPEGELNLTLSPQINDVSKTLAPGLPSLKLPADVLDFYVIVSSDPKNSKFPIKLDLIDVGDDKLKMGETLWKNQTNHQISAKLGSIDMTVAPSSQIITKAPNVTSGQFVAKFSYQANGTGKSLEITEQNWWYDVNSKNLGLIIDTGEKLPKILLFRDFRNP